VPPHQPNSEDQITNTKVLIIQYTEDNSNQDLLICKKRNEIDQLDDEM
jgi:hypothetical protein